MTLKLSSFAAALALALPLVGQAAPLANGGFESGLSGWATLGDASTQAGGTQGAMQLWLSTASDAFEDDHPLTAGALNRSGTAAAEVGVPGGVEWFAGLALGSLDPEPASGLQAYEGSAARQSFSANVGDVLSFAWDFATRDTGADFAFVVVDGVVSTLASASFAASLSPDGEGARSGWGRFSHTFATAGVHELVFGVVDVGDYAMTSSLAVDGVVVSPVPEPHALALLVPGLLVLGLGRRRRR
ncbi:MAG: hypothetical protein ACM32J_18085 [Rhizobacter sp.]